MTETHQPVSGVDMARAALAAARAAAKTRPTQPARKKTRTRQARTGGRDPMALGAAITGMMTDRGWEEPEADGSIIDQWPTIAPELADKVAAVRFEHDTGILHLKPASDAYATQLRLFRPQLLRRIREKTGSPTVRNLKILTPGAERATGAEEPQDPASTAAAEAPVRTREDGCPGYQDARAIVLEHRPPPPPADPYVERAMRRQEAVLRAGRPSETEHHSAGETGRMAGVGAVDCGEAVRRAAIARKRREQADGGQGPRRAFDSA